MKCEQELWLCYRCRGPVTECVLCLGCELSHKFGFFPSLKTFFFAQVMLSVSEGECNQGSSKDRAVPGLVVSRAEGRVLEPKRSQECYCWHCFCWLLK